MGRPAATPTSLAEKLTQPDWVLILTDIRAEVRVWDGGRWEWLHSSGTREDHGQAEGALTAAARAQEAILRRARETSEMVPVTADTSLKPRRK
jgi:hypothetical protein